MANQIVKFAPIHEQIVLGSMIRDRESREDLKSRLSTSDFYAPNNRLIFAALIELVEKRLDFTHGTFKTFLPSDKDWGGTEYIDKLLDMQSKENLEYHIKRMKWDNSRNLILGHDMSELESILKDPRSEPDEAKRVLTEMQNYVEEVDEETDFIQGPGAAATYQARLYARETGHHIRTSGYIALDKKLTNPFAPGLITIVSATPSIGKTTFCLNMAMRQAKRWNVGYLAWEGGHISAIDTICSCALNIPLDNIIKFPQHRTREEKESMDKYVDELFDPSAKLSFLKPPPDSMIKGKSPWQVNEAVIDWVEAKLKKWNRDIVYWDLFEISLPDTQPHAITWAVKRIQRIAKDTNTHIVLLQQINLKLTESLADKRPTRALVKGAGIYVEAADFLFGLYRDAVYNPRLTDDTFEVYCLKQRQGVWPFRIVFDWDGKCCRISGGNERQITIEDDYDDEV